MVDYELQYLEDLAFHEMNKFNRRSIAQKKRRIREAIHKVEKKVRKVK